MPRLPEKTRKTLMKIVRKMRVKNNVYGIGLFGSWSRGDASPSSDVDLLILEKGGFNHEYVERTIINSSLVDFNYIPKLWIHSLFPPELDQKIFETVILYDRDWALTNTKLLAVKFHSLSPT